jgi:hypothetical protein
MLPDIPVGELDSAGLLLGGMAKGIVILNEVPVSLLPSRQISPP